MGKKIYKGSSIEQCIKLACREQKVEENDLKYNIIEQTKGFFKKKIVIEVEVGDTEKEDSYTDILATDGTVTIDSGKVTVKDPIDGGKPAVICPAGNTKIIIDDKEINLKTEVFSKNKIEVILEQNVEPVRRMNIKLTPNNMEAYITVKYIPGIIYKLKNTQSSNYVVLDVEQERAEYPPIYTIDELKEQLAKNNVKYGIIEENLKMALNKEGVNKILIAKGDETINEEDDTLDILFKSGSKYEYNEDEKGTIDFKSIGFVRSVNKGATLAIKHTGSPGSDGKDVTGVTTKHKTGQKINLMIGEGCELKDDKVIAARHGEPSYIGQKFCIFEMHEVQTDVDISTGNIKFDGDVVIHGEIKEGMEVEAGNSVRVGKSIEDAKIIAKGNVTVQQNVILSSILAGAHDVQKIQLEQNYTNLYNNITDLIEGVKQVKHNNLLGDRITNGEIVKALLESRFKSITKISNDVLGFNDASEKIKNLLKDKFIGMGPLSIKFVDELVEISNLINNEVALLKAIESVPVDVEIGYSQNSTIQSSGNIIVTGKGQYVSHMIANEKITFLSPSSVARGGTIEAKDEVKCGVIGSIAAVPTRLKVDKEGHIYTKVAYPNTVFCVGSKEYIVDSVSKDIHAYLDINGDIKVDKFVL